MFIGHKKTSKGRSIGEKQSSLGGIYVGVRQYANAAAANPRVYPLPLHHIWENNTQDFLHEPLGLNSPREEHKHHSSGLEKKRKEKRDASSPFE